MKKDRRAYMKAWRLIHVGHKKAYKKAYYLAHREQALTYAKNYRLAHPMKIKKDQKAYYLAHREQRRTYNQIQHRAYYLAHKEQMLAKAKNYRLEHKEEIKARDKAYKLKYKEKLVAQNKIYSLTHTEQIREYLQSPNGKASNRRNSKKMKAKRRQFGFIPLNDYFNGSHGHHIDKEHVIYIPKTIHKAEKHSLLRNRNMEAINKLAFEFMKKNEWRRYGKEMDYIMPVFIN